MVTLAGGADPENIFWQVAGQTTLGTTSDFKGIILCKTLIAMQTGATLTGRALAQTAVTLEAATIAAQAPVTVDDGNTSGIVMPVRFFLLPGLCMTCTVLGEGQSALRQEHPA